MFRLDRPLAHFVGVVTSFGPEQRVIWEVRCIPGNLIGVGAGPDEAWNSLAKLIRWTADEEASFEAWYREAWNRAEVGDAEIFERHLMRSIRSLRGPIKVHERAVLVVQDAPAPRSIDEDGPVYCWDLRPGDKRVISAITEALEKGGGTYGRRLRDAIRNAAR